MGTRLVADNFLIKLMTAASKFMCFVGVNFTSFCHGTNTFIFILNQIRIIIEGIAAKKRHNFNFTNFGKTRETQVNLKI